MESEVVGMSAVALAAIGAAFSGSIGGLGSSLGMGIAGTKGSGVIAEKPHLATKVIILAAMPGSQAIYGLVIALLILMKIGVFDESLANLSKEDGFSLLSAGVLMGLAGLFSGWLQGKVAAGGIAALARDESSLGKGITLSALVETTALFGLLGAVMLMLLVGK